MVFEHAIPIDNHHSSEENHDQENYLGENLGSGPSGLNFQVVLFELVWISYVSLADIRSYLAANVVIFSQERHAQLYRRPHQRLHYAGEGAPAEVAEIIIIRHKTPVRKFPDVSDD